MDDLSNRPKLHLIQLKKWSIMDQLRLEEALLRLDQRNWCILNEGASQAIVMGISTKPEQVIHYPKLNSAPVPLIKRFTGGGTVFIDENCLLSTFICNSDELKVPCFPKAVFEWSESFYQSLFPTCNFALRENDYVIDQKKFGGNAQYMSKNRWLHHSSLLWDYAPENMEYLKMPPKMPGYRQNRIHSDFLCRLNSYYPNKEKFMDSLVKRLSVFFSVHAMPVSEIEGIVNEPHRKVTQEIV